MSDVVTDKIQRSAVLSPCGLYRYALERLWNEREPPALFIGLNPSTADAIVDDNTIRVCMNYAARWGYGGLLMANLFAFRSTDPRALHSAADPVGPDNDLWIDRLVARAGIVLCAWTKDGRLHGRDRAVLARLKNPHCLVQCKDGSPGHPLYKKATLRPIPFSYRP
jgi:hypothetical protein